MGRCLPVAKPPTIKLTRVDGERFCAKSRFEIRRHTLCISRVSNRRVGAKEPPATAGDFIVGCLKQRRRTQTAKLGCGRTPRVSYDPLGERSRMCNVDFAILICHSEPVLTLAWESQSTVLNVEIATTSLRTGFAMTTSCGT